MGNNKEKILKENKKMEEKLLKKDAKKRIFRVGDKKSAFNMPEKEKKPKEKKDYKLAFKEFPVKFTKEVSRIRWVGKGNLGKKFLVTLLFIAAFALFYTALDQILVHLFGLAHII